MSDTQVVPSFIGGEYVSNQSGETFETLNPATGEVLAKVEIAGAAEIELAVEKAAAAFKTWKKMTGVERGRILIEAARRLREANDSLAKLEVEDSGKPIAEAAAVDVASAADCLEYFGGIAASLHGQHFDLGGTAFAYTRREPLGVCLGIGAWNYPIQIAAWKAAPALAAGNTMIFS